MKWTRWLCGISILPLFFCFQIDQGEASELSCAPTAAVTDKSLPKTIRNLRETSPGIWFGRKNLWVILPKSSWVRLSSDGTYELKMGWYRLRKGEFRLRGELVGGNATATTNIPGGYPETGFQPTGISFPVGGCWKVTGTLSTSSVSFLVQIG